MRRLRHLESSAQIRASFGRLARAYVLDFTLANDRAALRTGSRPHIHHPVSRANHFGVMFDHHNRVAGLRELLEHVDDAHRVALMQPHGRLVEHVGHARQTGAELSRQTNALHLAARKARCFARQRQIPQTDVNQKAHAL